MVVVVVVVVAGGVVGSRKGLVHVVVVNRWSYQYGSER